MSRIVKNVVSLDRNKIAEFFEQRASRFSKDAPYSSVLYQDKNPDIAIERDRYEKERVTSLLSVNGNTRILDIGCGIGRWAETLATSVKSYTGIDLSPKLIEIAKSRITLPNTHFLVGSAEDVARLDVAARGPFDLVVMSGIMIYLNDDELHSCLLSLARSVAAGGEIYMREPLAINDRLTLSEFWSDELNQEYSAIYRSARELDALFSKTLYPAGFEPIQFQLLYADAKLNNRRETAQHFAIARRSRQP